MRIPWKLLSAALVAASVPWFTGSAGAAPLSSSLALKGADAAAVEQVQWRRRWHRGRWIGPGVAAGVVIGGAFAPRYYYDYGYVPGSRPYRSYGYGYRRYVCTGDSEADSANPSWACPYSR
jgi:hypothetical protein